MSGFKQLTAAMYMNQNATIDQLVNVSATVHQKAANERFQQFTTAVKRKATIEQCKHISTMVKQGATNKRFQAAHCGCEAESDDGGFSSSLRL